MTVLPVSGNLLSELVETLKPLLQQLRVVGPFVQDESRWTISGTAAARDVDARANRPAPMVWSEYIMW